MEMASEVETEAQELAAPSTAPLDGSSMVGVVALEGGDRIDLLDQSRQAALAAALTQLKTTRT
jgi:hypothetical protein